MKKILLIFLMLSSIVFAGECNGNLDKDVVILDKKSEVTLKKMTIAMAYDKYEEIISYRKDLIEIQELIKHILNDHMEELSYDNILDLIKMKEQIDEVISGIDENMQ